MRRGLLLMMILLIPGQLAGAWTPRGSRGVAFHATRVMPASFRTILQIHRTALARGATEGLQATSTEDIGADAEAIVGMIRSQRPFREVVYELGRLSARMARANEPPLVAIGGDSAEAWSAHFSSYIEQSIPLFRVYFPGYREDLRGVEDLVGACRSSRDRACRLAPHLVGIYQNAQAPLSTLVFDSRSIPFGVASISYSHAVEDTANAWLLIWRLAGGDLGELPYGLHAPALTASSDTES